MNGEKYIHINKSKIARAQDAIRPRAKQKPNYSVFCESLRRDSQHQILGTLQHARLSGFPHVLFITLSFKCRSLHLQLIFIVSKLCVLMFFKKILADIFMLWWFFSNRLSLYTLLWSS